MRILLPFCTAVRENWFYQEFHAGITDALRELDYEPVRFPFKQIGSLAQPEAEALLREIDGRDHVAVLDIACWGYGLTNVTLSMVDGSTKPIFDALDLACVGMLLDHPWNQAMAGIRARKFYAAYPDRGHAQQTRLTYPGLAFAGEIFLPPAVRPASDCSAVNAPQARDIDVLYVGNLDRSALERFWNDRISPLWNESYDPRFCNAVVDIALDKPERSLHLNIDDAVATAGPPAAEHGFAPQLRAVEHHLRHLFRNRAVMALAASGVRVRTIGRGWEAAALPGNVVIETETSYEGMFQLAARAKICLDASTYLDGANDRVFGYSLNGAVCVTNAAGYLRDAFGEGEIGFYSVRDLDALGEQVKALLGRPAALHEAGQRARATVLASHTWRNRMEKLLRAIAARGTRHEAREFEP
jgi:glycosyltransferase involved in cell wall biosynthesis